MFRLLEAHEIKARVKSVIVTDKWKGVTILLYKDARCDMAILDEEYGPTNWQDEYQMVGSQMFCTISVWDAVKNQWIRKQSNGVESNTEAEKGQASDAFKRAAFMVGIGRELYTAPDIFIECAGEGEITNQRDNYSGKDKYKCNCDFTVKEIDYDGNRNICYLVLAKTYRKKESICLTWGSKQTHGKQKEEPKPQIGVPKADEALEPANTEQTKEPQYVVFYNALLNKCGDEEKLKTLLKQCGAHKKSDINAFVYGQVEKHLNET